MTDLGQPISLPLSPGINIVFDCVTGEIRTSDYQAMWQEAARSALIWRRQYEDAWEALNRIWEATGCIRTKDAPEVVSTVHDIAHGAIHGNEEDD